VITTHPAYKTLLKLADEREESIYGILATELEILRKKASKDGVDESLVGLTKDIHMYPDFRGESNVLIHLRINF